jgi:transmembrane sensor
MSQIKVFKDKNTIQEEAAEWVVKLDNQDLSAEERAAFIAWIKESLRHKLEFIELAKVWGNMDLLAQLAEEVPAHTVSAQPSPAGYTFKRRYISYASAAVIALFCFLAVIQTPLYESSEKHLMNPEQRYTTAVGEIRDIQLADGSTMTLNTNSQVSINFRTAERGIYLHQGEANFVVAKEAQRPFIVYVAEGSVTAVGTVFNVKLTDDIADVIVSEGKVKVEATTDSDTAKSLVGTIKKHLQPNKPVATQIAVSAGQKIRIAQKSISAVDAIPVTVMERELSWQTGMLLFADTPLQEVIREISRYTNTKIVIQDTDLASLPVAGYFKAGETAAMLEVLQISFDIKVTELANNYIVLSKRDSFINR